MLNDQVLDSGAKMCRLEDWVGYEPVGRVRWRESHLEQEVCKLWNAQSFLTWRYGLFFNTHVIVMARPLGMIDHREFAGLVAKFNKEMARWLKVAGTPRRGRWCKRTMLPEPSPHLWMYVFENSVRRGLHLHQLCVVPKHLRRPFEEHVRAWWERAACLEIDPSAIFVRCRPAHGADGLTRHSILVRYLLKSTSQALWLLDKLGCECWNVNEVLRLKPYPKTWPVYVPQMAGICRALSASAQQVPVSVNGEEYQFVSKLLRGDPQHLFDGSEYAEFIERQRRETAFDHHSFLERLML